ncbi:MAG: 30S ribosome-binding factor RbfA [Thermodesulfobacteriota bacterium]
MAFKRADRMGEVIKRDISLILLNEIEDPQMGFLTITKVKMSDDLRIARIYYSILGGEKEKKNTQESLERTKGFVRRTLGKRLRIRYVPELIFRFDDSLEYGSRIESLINELKESGDSGE